MGKNYKDREAIIVDFSKRLRKERKRLKMTQKQLADEIGVDIKTIGNWEQCNTLPKKLDDALALCNLFECDIDYLFGRQKEKTKTATDICEATGLKAEAVKYLLDNKKYNWDADFLSFFMVHDNCPKILERVFRKGVTFDYIRMLKEKGAYERLKKIYIQTKIADHVDIFDKGEHEDRYKAELYSSIGKGVFSASEIKSLEFKDIVYEDEESGIAESISGPGIEMSFNYLYDADNMEKEYWIINYLFQGVVADYLKAVEITEDDYMDLMYKKRG